MAEYSEERGTPSRMPDGSERRLSAAERARVARISAMRDLPDNVSPREQEILEPVDGPAGGARRVVRPLAADVEKIAEMRAKTNRYSDGIDSLSGDPQ